MSQSLAELGTFGQVSSQSHTEEARSHVPRSALSPHLSAQVMKSFLINEQALVGQRFLCCTNFLKYVSQIDEIVTKRTHFSVFVMIFSAISPEISFPKVVSIRANHFDITIGLKASQL